MFVLLKVNSHYQETEGGLNEDRDGQRSVMKCLGGEKKCDTLCGKICCALRRSLLISLAHPSLEENDGCSFFEKCSAASSRRVVADVPGGAVAASSHHVVVDVPCRAVVVASFHHVVADVPSGHVVVPSSHHVVADVPNGAVVAVCVVALSVVPRVEVADNRGQTDSLLGHSSRVLKKPRMHQMELEGVLGDRVKGHVKRCICHPFCSTHAV